MPYKDPKIAQAYFKAYRIKNHSRYADYDKDRNSRPERMDLMNTIKRRLYHQQPDKERDRRLQKNFGITLAEYNSILVKQDSVCAVCKEPETRKARGQKINYLAVDHDHVTGKVRGLLCANCNTALGLLEDDPQLLIAAAKYVENYMPYTAGQVKNFPETEASIDAHADEQGVGYIRSSQSVGYGHEDSMNRLPNPNAEWAADEPKGSYVMTESGTKSYHKA